MPDVLTSAVSIFLNAGPYHPRYLICTGDVIRATCLLLNGVKCVSVCVSFHRDFHRRYGRLFFFSVGHAIFLRTVGFTVRNAVRTAFIHNTTGDPIAFEEGYMVFDRYGVCACVCACVCVSVCVCVCVC